MSQDGSPTRPDAHAPRAGRRRTDARLVRRPAAWLLAGIGLAFLVGIGIALGITQTRWGREQVLAYTLRVLGGRFSGELSIARVEGNLFTGARLYALQLRGYDGVPLATMDSAYIQYRVATLTGGDVLIHRLVTWNAEINILRMPGDTAWNYQEILRDPTPEPTTRPGAALIERLVLNDARILIRAPLEPDPRLDPDRAQRELEEILADTARYVTQEVPGGYLVSRLLEVDTAALREVFIGPAERGGIYLESEDIAADVRIWRDPPLEVRSLVGQLHLREGILSLRVPAFALPDSRGDLLGGIDLTGERPMYDLVVRSPQFAVSDLRWLFPWLPDDPDGGAGSARVWIEDRPDELLVLTRDLTLEMPGTRVTGEFGVLLGPDLIRFANVELEADPLDVESVEQLFPEGFPIEGLEIGEATLRGE